MKPNSAIAPQQYKYFILPTVGAEQQERDVLVLMLPLAKECGNPYAQAAQLINVICKAPKEEYDIFESTSCDRFSTAHAISKQLAAGGKVRYIRYGWHEMEKAARNAEKETKHVY